MSAWRVITAATVAPQAWRNGGGSTRELLAQPTGGAWSLRISLAQIDEAGPFSAYPGVERWFTVVEGAGVALRFGDSSEELERGPGSPPLRFDGATPVACRLLQGATQDLNLMIAQGRGSMVPVRAGRAWHAASLQGGIFARVAGVLHAPDGTALHLAAQTLAWCDALGGATLRFEPTAAAPPAGWWLSFTP